MNAPIIPAPNPQTLDDLNFDHVGIDTGDHDLVDVDIGPVAAAIASGPSNPRHDLHPSNPPQLPSTAQTVAHRHSSLQEKDEKQDEQGEEGESVVTDALTHHTLPDLTRNANRPSDLDVSAANATMSNTWRADRDGLQKSDGMPHQGSGFSRPDEEENEEEASAALLALLEQENNKLVTNPKTASVRHMDTVAIPPTLLPPTIAQLRQMVTGPTPSALRYSMLPPPPMTDLEFYAALVKDYRQTAARLPTLLSRKIHKGIPPPLRGVIWQSMSGARDPTLEELYDRLCVASSPHEPIILKDLGRSFPGVDMFRDPDGEGQRMLGRVLRAYSLHDPEIGYCQGLAFIVGPLLMHMADKQAFCVLVRLMERYSLRTSYLPDLPGLHVRIYQFRMLLQQLLPELSTHLAYLQLNPDYVSQWFLSIFAVTAPLPMLFRVYDVMFAEGAPETLMRVALCLMLKNQDRLMACVELEDAMQLLLSRGLWDCYNYNADELVDDFVGLGHAITRDKLHELERAYMSDTQVSPSGPDTVKATSALDVIAAASGFLGRMWPSTVMSAASAPQSIPPLQSTKSKLPQPQVAATLKTFSASPRTTNLSPVSNPQSRPQSILARTASKQSLASTFNSTDTGPASVASVASSTSTMATTSSSRDSQIRQPQPLSPGSGNATDEKYLHNQIEDLLTALGELQRGQAVMVDQLQREREEREEDRAAVRLLLRKLRTAKRRDDQTTGGDTDDTQGTQSANRADGRGADGTKDADENTPIPGAARTNLDGRDADDGPWVVSGTESGGLWISSAGKFQDLLTQVEQRFSPVLGSESPETMIESKAQLHEELRKARDQLMAALVHTQDLNRHIHDLNNSINQSHAHVRNLHQDKQRLEKHMHSVRTSKSLANISLVEPGGSPNLQSEAEDEIPGTPTLGGLRELRLGRGVGSRLSRRVSSLGRQQATPMVGDQDSLLMVLLQAKSSEATAKQELDDLRQKLESLRRTYGLENTPVPMSPEEQAARGKFPTAATSPRATPRVANGIAETAAAQRQQSAQQLLSSTASSASAAAAVAAASAASAASSAASAAMGVFGRFTAGNLSLGNLGNLGSVVDASRFGVTTATTTETATTTASVGATADTTATTDGTAVNTNPGWGWGWGK